MEVGTVRSSRRSRDGRKIRLRRLRRVWGRRERDFRLRVTRGRVMGIMDHMARISFEAAACDRMTRSSAPRAQTERRGDAGPVRDQLSGETSPAAFLGSVQLVTTPERRVRSGVRPLGYLGWTSQLIQTPTLLVPGWSIQHLDHVVRIQFHACGYLRPQDESLDRL